LQRWQLIHQVGRNLCSGRTVEILDLRSAIEETVQLKVIIKAFSLGATEWRSMRVTVSHSRRKEEIMRSVDRSFDDLFKGFGAVSIQIVNESRKWTGSRMDFSFDAKVGIVSTPIKGFVDVTDKDVTVDADLGWLERLIPAKETQAAFEGRVKGLLT
jgi:hypothetical protein